MPNFLPQPPVASEAYRLRLPDLPPVRGKDAAPLLYTERDLERARREGAEAGRREAHASFERERRALEEETLAAVQECAGLAGSLEAQRRGLLEEAVEGVVGLAFQIAARVLRREVAQDPEAVVPVVRELLQRSAAAETLTVRLSPRDHGRLVAHPEAVPEAAGIEGVRLRPDAAIEPGGCVVETEAGCLDARLETQLERIRLELRGSEGEAP